MARVTRPGGTIAASVWDFEAGGSPLAIFWRAVRDLDPHAPQEDHLPGTRRGHLRTLAEAAGIGSVQDIDVAIDVHHSSFDEWWEPYTYGVGPSGAYVASLSDSQVSALRDSCRDLLPEGGFTIPARAWAVRGLKK
jgi:hypothetical protein